MGPGATVRQGLLSSARRTPSLARGMTLYFVLVQTPTSLPRATSGMQVSPPGQAEGSLKLHRALHLSSMHARFSPHLPRVQSAPALSAPGATQAVCPVSEFTTVQYWFSGQLFPSNLHGPPSAHTGMSVPVLMTASMSQKVFVPRQVPSQQ